MTENRKGFILTVKEVENVANIQAPQKVMVLDDKGQIQTVKKENVAELLEIYPLLRLDSMFIKQQPEPSIHLKISLEILKPRGSLEEYYREPSTEAPVFDNVFYVISGRVRATIGDMEKIVGAGTLIYCPSNVKHSLTNVGKGLVKYLAVCGQDEGKKLGEPIYSKMPTWRI